MPRQPIGNTKSKNLINEKNLGEEPVVKWTEREKERERERERETRIFMPVLFTPRPEGVYHFYETEDEGRAEG